MHSGKRHAIAEVHNSNIEKHFMEFIRVCYSSAVFALGMKPAAFVSRTAGQTTGTYSRVDWNQIQFRSLPCFHPHILCIRCEASGDLIQVQIGTSRGA